MRIALDLVPAHHEIDDGFSRYMYPVANALIAADTNHEFLVILGPRGNPKLLSVNARCTVVQCAPGNQNFNQQVRVARLAKSWGADLLHNFGAPASILWSKPLILTIHDAAIVMHPELFPRRWVLYQRLMYAALKKKNPQVLTVSEHSKRDIAIHMGFAPERIHVVYPIPAFQPREVSIEEREYARTTYHLPDEFFLYVGVIEPRKNLVRLIQAFELYRAAGGRKALVIGGGVGWKAEATMSTAKSSPSSAHIHFPGFIASELLPGVIAGAHAFVFPSLEEGFGSPPIEALAFDVPVLSSNASCLPEILGDAALLVDPLSVQSIADGLVQIDTNATLRNRLIVNGRVRRARYSADMTRTGILMIYRSFDRP